VIAFPHTDQTAFWAYVATATARWLLREKFLQKVWRTPTTGHTFAAPANEQGVVAKSDGRIFEKFFFPTCTGKKLTVLLQPLWKQGDQNYETSWCFGVGP
jgi:hypothetical protein